MEKSLKCALVCMSSLALGACEKEIISDDFTTDNPVSITTRSVNAEETISYPVVVYVFDQESKKCVDYKMLSDKETPLVFNLPIGTYAFYALGGIDQELYDVPTDNLTEKSEITLKEGKEHADLMTARQTLELKKDEDKDLVLNMERQVIELTSVTFSQIPTDITDISISVTPCYKGITIDGEPGTPWEHPYPLANDGDGVWSRSSPTMILLSTESPSIIISMRSADGTVKEYTYQCNEDLKKNYQIRINGTFEETNTITITGSITGATWAGTNEITLNFGEGTMTDNWNEDGIIQEETPAVGTTYNGCFVLDVTQYNKYNEVLLAYKEDILLVDYNIKPTGKTEDAVLQEINGVFDTLSVDNLSGWRLPDESEVAKIISQKDALAQYGINVDLNDYFYMKGQSLKVFNRNGFLNSTYDKGKKMIPVVTAKFKK